MFLPCRECSRSLAMASPCASAPSASRRRLADLVVAAPTALEEDLSSTARFVLSSSRCFARSTNSSRTLRSPNHCRWFEASSSLASPCLRPPPVCHRHGISHGHLSLPSSSPSRHRPLTPLHCSLASAHASRAAPAHLHFGALEDRRALEEESKLLRVQKLVSFFNLHSCVRIKGFGRFSIRGCRRYLSVHSFQ